MKQIAQYQDGRIELHQVPIPQPPVGGVLVRTRHSVISIGTEKMKVEQAKMNLLQKARARPDQVRKVVDTAKTLGWRTALEKVRNRLSSPTPLGYSAAGIVEAVDASNTRYSVGDRVACAGAECAHHAEYIAVPDLLTAPVPDDVPLWMAAYTTVTSIALQAVRQAEVQIGDRVAVIGQGLIGLLVTDLCRLAGARVLAADIVESRDQISRDLGAEEFVVTGSQDVKEAVHSWAGGRGVDSVFVYTATSSSAPVEQAAELARDRGRVVIVGITNVDLPRQVFYDKELDLRFSRSYGPGRYDAAYEWAGQDYPFGYVRWTEGRNFEACLQLMRGNSLKLDRLTTRRVPFDQSLSVYEELADNVCEDVGIVIDYSHSDPIGTAETQGAPESTPRAPDSRVKQPVIRLDVIGAGNFAKTMLLPHLQNKIVFGTVVNRRALSAAHAGRKFGFERHETGSESIFDTDQPSATLIATRHHLHAPLVIESVKRDRPVFVEKPLCITLAELAEIDNALGEHPDASIQVGFNRRFSPASQSLRRLADKTPGPKTVVYTVVPGRLDPASWYADPHEGGGRVVGEACHFFDFFVFLLRARPVAVSARTLWPTESTNGLADSISAQVDFEDGSCAFLVYHAEAGTKYPKEVVRMFAAGITARINNFKSLETYTRTKVRKMRCTSKGHGEQMAAWLAYLKGEREHPLPYAEARDSMLLTFRALEAIRTQTRIAIGHHSEAGHD